MQSRVSMIVRFVGGEILGNVFEFPVWWYTRGLMGVVRYGVRSIVYRAQSYGLLVWIRNLFVPMYGMHDWTARLISFCMRVIVLFFRTGALVCEAGAYVVMTGVWVVVLPVSVVALFVNGMFLFL